MRPRLPLLPLFALCCAAVALRAGASVGLPVAGTQEHLWLALETADAESVRILHSHSGDDPGTIRPARVLPGRLSFAGIAAHGRELWAVHADGTVNVVIAKADTQTGVWTYGVRQERKLPRGVTPRALTAGADGVWVLVRVESAQALHALDHPPDDRSDALEEDDPLFRDVLGLPPLDEGKTDADADADAEPEPQTDAVQDAADEGAPEETPAPPTPTPPTPTPRPETAGRPAAKPAAAPVAEDRLLWLHRGQWRSVALPDGWVSGSPVDLVAQAGAGRPTLVSVPHDAEAGDASLWRWRGTAWEREPIADQGPSARTDAVAVGGQLVLAHHVDGRAAVAAVLVRGGRALPLGERAIDGAVRGRWGVAGWRGQLAVLHESEAAAEAPGADAAPPGPALGIVMQTIDLRGGGAGDPVMLTLAPERALGRPDQVVMMAVLGTATVLMFVFWRRDPRRNRLVIPDGYRIAPLLPRAIAGLIDLAPGLVLVLLLEGISPPQMLTRWPVHLIARSWEDMVPGLLVIGVTVAHTMLSEIVTGRSLGKRIMGMEVRSLTGRKAAPIQIVLRCALKAFDLSAQLLLLLPVIGPFRQRLGDLVGRTVVFAPAPEPEEPEQEAGDDQ